MSIGSAGRFRNIWQARTGDLPPQSPARLQFLDVESYEYGKLAALMATFTAVFLPKPPHSQSSPVLRISVRKALGSG